jgi:hypothetical protein
MVTITGFAGNPRGVIVTEHSAHAAKTLVLRGKAAQMGNRMGLPNGPLRPVIVNAPYYHELSRLLSRGINENTPKRASYHATITLLSRTIYHGESL